MNYILFYDNFFYGLLGFDKIFHVIESKSIEK